MANFYTDSHGTHWGVMIQEKTTSCGPASVAMTEVYYKSSIVADLETRVRSISQKYPGAWKASVGTMVSNLVDVLRHEGVKCYDELCVQPAAVWPYLYQYARESTPIIVHITWGKGAHFAVCPWVYKDWTCVFLDPWYGLVEVDGANLPKYIVGDPTGNFEPVAKGSLSGWCVITKR